MVGLNEGPETGVDYHRDVNVDRLIDAAGVKASIDGRNTVEGHDVLISASKRRRRSINQCCWIQSFDRRPR